MPGTERDGLKPVNPSIRRSEILKLTANWRAVMAHAWSVRLMLLAALLSGLEVALPLMHGFFPLDPGVFALLSFLATVGAFVARFVAQKGISNGNP